MIIDGPAEDKYGLNPEKVEKVSHVAIMTTKTMGEIECKRRHEEEENDIIGKEEGDVGPDFRERVGEAGGKPNGANVENELPWTSSISSCPKDRSCSPRSPSRPGPPPHYEVERSQSGRSWC